MAEYGISLGEQVAVVCDSYAPPKALQKFVQDVQAVIGAENQVSVENVNQLLYCECSEVLIIIVNIFELKITRAIYKGEFFIIINTLEN